MGKYSYYIFLCYIDWYKTQYKDISKDKCNYSWLINIPEFHATRVPENTCLSAIEQGANGTLEKPINQSKGCGYYTWT